MGCHIRPKLNSLPDEIKGQNNHFCKNTKATTLSEDFWTTSNRNMDNNALQSCGSISSTSTLTQVYDAHGAGCSNPQTEFVNHGMCMCVNSFCVVMFLASCSFYSYIVLSHFLWISEFHLERLSHL